jgi:hypothetical protein
MAGYFKQYGSGDPATAPQLWMAATEQGYTSSQYSNEQRAQFLCQIYNITLQTPKLLWVAMNDFQDYGGDVYALLAASVGVNLENSAQSPEYQAFTSSKPVTWGTPNHYCCVTYRLGC